MTKVITDIQGKRKGVGERVLGILGVGVFLGGGFTFALI